MKTFASTKTYCLQQFGQKAYKLALSASRSCPNRDGTCGRGGCIFCSEGGSGDFAQSAALPVGEQISRAIAFLGQKAAGRAYIAYFQSFTATYGDLPELFARYREAAEDPRIAAVSLATRPDCLGPEVMAELRALAAVKPLWIELGLQTMHERTAKLIGRGYPLEVYDDAMARLKELGVHRITHVILGLPGETRKDMLETVKYAGALTDGIKLQLLHVLRGTPLEEMFRSGAYSPLTLEEYVDLLADALAVLPEDVVIHRITGDGPKNKLLAPSWSGDKKRVLNTIKKALPQKGFIID